MSNASVQSLAVLKKSNGAQKIGFKVPVAAAIARTFSEKVDEIVSVADFGAVGDGEVDDTVAINSALSSGVKQINFLAGKTYLVSSGLFVPDNVKIISNGAGIKRDSQHVTSITAAIAKNVTLTFGVSDSSGFKVGQTIAITKNGVSRSSLVYGVSLSRVRKIIAISANLITIDLPFDIDSAAGGVCFVAYSVMTLGENATASGFIFDGNRDNWSFNRWEVISEIVTAQGKKDQDIKNNTFVNSPSESILVYGENTTISGNRFNSINGNAIHLSGAIGCVIEKNQAVNGNIDLDVGHQDGFVSFSNLNRNVLVSGNVASSFISGVGALNNTDADITISANDFYNMYCFGIEGGAGVANILISKNRIKNVATQVEKRPLSPYFGGIVFIGLSAVNYTICENIIDGVNDNKSIAISGTGTSKKNLIVNNNILGGDALIVGVNGWALDSNVIDGDLKIGATDSGVVSRNKINVLATQVAISLNASAEYKDLDINNNIIDGGVYGVSLTTSAISYKSVNISNNKLINQTTRSISLDTYGGVVSGLQFNNNEVICGSAATTSFNGFVVKANGVTIKNNTLVNQGAKASKTAINCAGIAVAGLSVVSANEIRGEWANAIILTANSGINVAFNNLEFGIISNQAGNFLNNNLAFGA